jgi:hypothetical protein
MPIKKEYIFVSSDQKVEGCSVGPTQFTVHLPHPLTNVIKTDLVKCNFTIKDNLGSSGPPPYVFIQSVNLGNDIITPQEGLQFWRMVFIQGEGTNKQETSSRVDAYLDYERTINDVDITVYDPIGTNYGPEPNSALVPAPPAAPWLLQPIPKWVDGGSYAKETDDTYGSMVSAEETVDGITFTKDFVYIGQSPTITSISPLPITTASSAQWRQWDSQIDGAYSSTALYKKNQYVAIQTGSDAGTYILTTTKVPVATGAGIGPVSSSFNSVSLLIEVERRL